MAEDCFHNPDDPYDAVWHQKLGVIPVPNGDHLGIDLKAGHQGEVVYLSHDDGSGHGHALGADLIDFLRRWTPLGCPGPEDGQWLPFTSGGTTMLNPDGEAALAWRRILGLAEP